MTKFEQVGINYQLNADDKKQAMRSFNHNCYCCCTKGIRIECERCCIAEAHNKVMAYFDDMEVKAKEEGK